MELEDVQQQGYVALAETVLDWEPERRSSFLPYFFNSFPWRIDRYLRSQTPSRRSSRLQLYSLPHDLAVQLADEVAGQDGRDWDDSLAFEELLEGLPELPALAIRLHLFRGLPFAQVAGIAGVGRSTAHEAFGRGISILRTELERA